MPSFSVLCDCGSETCVVPSCSKHCILYLPYGFSDINYWLLVVFRVVLFLDRQCEKCTISEKALLEAATEQQPIAAQVCL